MLVGASSNVPKKRKKKERGKREKKEGEKGRFNEDKVNNQQLRGTQVNLFVSCERSELVVN